MKSVESGDIRSRGFRRCLAGIPFLLFPACFIFWLFGYNGHIVYKESSSLFLFTDAYWRDTLVQPGGLGIYLANFLTQFFRWPASGALLITLNSFVLWLLCWNIARRLRVVNVWPVFVWSVPVVSCFMMMTVEATFSDLCHLSLLFVAFWGYVCLPDRIWRLGTVLVGFVPLALLLPEAALICFYLSVLLMECVYWGNIRFRELLFFGIYMFLLVILPMIWRRYLLVLDDRVLYFTAPDQWVYGLLPFTAAGLSVSFRYRLPSHVGWIALSWCVIAGVGAKLAADRYNRFEESLLQMDRAADLAEWDRIIAIADKQEIFSRQMVYYLSVALAYRGKLGDKLFDYPMVGVNPFYQPRGYSYLSSSSAHHIFEYLQMPNAGLIYTFDASMGMRYDVSFKTLKNLIQMNLKKRNRRLADKYLAVLDRSLLYGHWVKEQRIRLASLPDSSLTEPDDFFIGYAPLTDAVAQTVANCPQDVRALDYLLCSYLLEKRLDEFCMTFIRYYPYRTEKRIPRYYQQALLVAKEMNILALKGADADIRFSEDICQLYAQFNGIAKFDYGDERVTQNRLMTKFGNTWWCYFLFANIDGISSPSARSSVN